MQTQVSIVELIDYLKNYNDFENVKLKTIDFDILVGIVGIVDVLKGSKEYKTQDKYITLDDFERGKLIETRKLKHTNSFFKNTCKKRLDQWLSDADLIKHIKEYNTEIIKRKDIDVDPLIKIVDILKSKDYLIEKVYSTRYKTDDKGNNSVMYRNTSKVCFGLTQKGCSAKVQKEFKKLKLSYDTHDYKVIGYSFGWAGFISEFDNYVDYERKTVKLFFNEGYNLQVKIRDDKDCKSIKFKNDDFYSSSDISNVDFLKKVKKHISNRLDRIDLCNKYNDRIDVLNTALKTL